jgi:putative tryptophan/tyrosine transport system substrate-binding protein
MIRRRAFLAAATAGVFARPMLGATHRAREVRHVGYLGGSSQAALLVESFRQGLRDLGYVEDKNVMLTIRWGEASADRLRRFADELVALGVEVIVAGPDSSIAAAKQATSTIPVVMCLSTDPVQAGFVRTLSRPGGNVTGLTLEASSEIHGKRLELLKEAFPAASQVTVLGNPKFAGRPSYRKPVESAARPLGVTVRFLDVSEPRDVDAAFQSLTNERPEALFVVSDPLVYSHRHKIVALAARLRLPAMYSALDWADAGGLMAYGPSRADLMRRAATYVDKILKGAKPADLPVEQPHKFELVFNRRTAKTLQVSIPAAVLPRVDRLIE